MTSLPIPLRIAVDAMGGDFGPQSTLPAVLSLARQYPDVDFQVYAEADVITSQSLSSPFKNITFVETINSVAMTDEPVYALRHKRDSSMALMINAVSKNNADGGISAGNTGALVAMGMHFLKTYEGIDRPALCQEIPTEGEPSYLLDLGANVDCSSEQLVQLACLGVSLCSVLHDMPSPKISLLNIGSESSKGSAAIKAASELLTCNKSLNYQGFIEGDALYKGETNVIVCDGFSGNVALKVSEGVARFVTQGLGSICRASLYGRLMTFLALPLLKAWQEKMDVDSYNGAYFLGLKGTVVKSHGGATTRQFSYALEMLINQLRRQQVLSLENQLQKYL